MCGRIHECNGGTMGSHDRARWISRRSLRGEVPLAGLGLVVFVHWETVSSVETTPPSSSYKSRQIQPTRKSIGVLGFTPKRMSP